MSDPAKKFTFKKSALADKADKIWSESKNDFSASKPTVSHVQLEKKTLGDVLGKIAASSAESKKKEQEEQTPCAFVFGSKIAERIVLDETKKDDAQKSTSDEKTMTATELFKTQVKKDEDKNGTSNFREEAQQEAERAKEAEKNLASTSVVELTTGEEADTNIFQASCKIWVFDRERKEYVEKGVCTLRINEIKENGVSHHRIIARTSGTLRVVINTKIFADMLLERPDKRIRISAMSAETSGVQVFLLKFGFSKADTGAEADLFFKTLADLLKLEKEQSRKRKADGDVENGKMKQSKTEEESGASSSKTAEATETAEAVEAVETSEAVEAVQAAEAVAAVEISEASEAAGTSETTETAEKQEEEETAPTSTDA